MVLVGSKILPLQIMAFKMDVANQQIEVIYENNFTNYLGASPSTSTMNL
ncbi:hypothetical protein RintRC_4432 [Richelia intracellularis]|nr:hypothetical protein RintRC_4432 [Richelia intracellularis]